MYNFNTAYCMDSACGYACMGLPHIFYVIVSTSFRYKLHAFSHVVEQIP